MYTHNHTYYLALSLTHTHTHTHAHTHAHTHTHSYTHTQEALAKRLEEIGMSDFEDALYRRFYDPVANEIAQLRVVLQVRISDESVMSHVKESRLINVMTHGVSSRCASGSWLVWMSHVSREWVMSHKPHDALRSFALCSRFVARLIELCLLWMSRVSHLKKFSYDKYDALRCFALCSRFFSRVNKSCHTWRSHVSSKSWRMAYLRGVLQVRGSYEWVMSHVNESCLTWEYVSYERYDALLSFALCFRFVSHVNASCSMWRSHVS